MTIIVITYKEKHLSQCENYTHRTTLRVAKQSLLSESNNISGSTDPDLLIIYCLLVAAYLKQQLAPNCWLSDS